MRGRASGRSWSIDEGRTPPVMPAKAGIHADSPPDDETAWTPAFAGVTEQGMTLETLSTARAFGGTQGVYRHPSRETGTDMAFAVYLPPQAEAGAKLPMLCYLSGLTCTHANVMEKGGYQRVCAELGLILVAPDTSPRGADVPDDPAYDFGQGAGFYVDAAEQPYARNYRMFSYIADELPALIEANFAVDPARQSISGHSMGGHGALSLALRNPGRYRSVSAFAPIVAP